MRFAVGRFVARIAVAELVLAAPLPAQAELAVEVNQAIDRGVAWLKAQQRPDGTYPCDHWCTVGTTALATYALLKSGVLAKDPAIQKSIDYLKYQPYSSTYATAVEICAFDAYGEKSVEDPLVAGAKWLEAQQRKDGEWGYPDRDEDLSNSQYAALGLWVAERHGFKAKRETWGNLLKELARRQNDDGGFGYHEHDASTGSITTAGIAMLTLALERVGDDSRYGSARERGRSALARAWKWLESNFTVDGNPLADHTITPKEQLYYLFGLERVAAIGDKKKIGDHDWYGEGARRLLKMQKKDGAWHNDDATSFALLFLRRATLTGMHRNAESDAAAAPASGKPAGPQRPYRIVPFLKRWLVCGPIADPKDELLEAPFSGETTVEPTRGGTFRGNSWMEQRKLGDFVGFGENDRPGDRVISYAFTWLHADQPADVVLWLGSDDGVRLFVDGKTQFTRHVHDDAARDRDSIPLSLAIGAHALLVKVENDRQTSGFFLRIAHADGTPAPEVRPSLRKNDAEAAATTLCTPELFELRDLRARLPALPRLDVDFGKAKDVELFAFSHDANEPEKWPRFIDAPGPTLGNPAPGARGLLAVHPLSAEVPVRIYFHSSVPGPESKLAVRVSEEAYGPPGRASFRLRLGVFVDDLDWLKEKEIGPDAAVEEKNWRTIEAPLERYAGKDVLFVIECAAPDADRWSSATAYFDDIAIR